MTYGNLPSRETFDQGWAHPDYGNLSEADVFKVRRCPRVGDHDFSQDELYDEIKAICDDDATDDDLSWASCVLSVLGIEWILGAQPFGAFGHMSDPKTEPQNLDAMTEEDLEAFRRTTKSYKLRLYAFHKAKAMRLRLAGNIDKALEHEALCERLYDTLPEALRW